jgi:5'-deoxynucleotidase YfbR-like HD superfamily hydrolase
MAKKMPLTFMQLGSGRYVDALRVGVFDVKIENIAWSLARMIRFGGHGKHEPNMETTVADHCLTLADMLARQGETPLTQLQGFMHDAGESFVVDVPRGIKCRDEMRFFRNAEDAAIKVIFRALGIPLPSKLREPVIKEWDMVSCLAEARLIMPDRGEGFQSATQERLALADEALADGLCWRFTPKRESMTIAMEFLHTYKRLRKEAGL